MVSIQVKEWVYIYIAFVHAVKDFSKMVVLIYTPVYNIRDPVAPYEEGNTKYLDYRTAGPVKNRGTVQKTGRLSEFICS